MDARAIEHCPFVGRIRTLASTVISFGTFQLLDIQVSAFFHVYRYGAATLSTNLDKAPLRLSTLERCCWHPLLTNKIGMTAPLILRLRRFQQDNLSCLR